ncbi:RagB/SusD family nutrient uptake outer membrane protein [Labilibacter sediminis]|nr:RagB/SusD family nutrient uptake outer membrane protein [Labilibacter sediminis]
MYFLAIIIMNVACNDDALDLSPADAVTDDAVFNSADPGLMKAFVNNVYQGLPDGFQWSMIASVSDEAHLNAGGWHGAHSIMKSQLTESNLSAFSPWGYYEMYNWDNVYRKIRAANLFLSKVDDSPADIEAKNVMKGEVYFLRGYLYHNLVAMYGGVPIIDKPYTLDENFNIARDTYADCIDFISNQCDSAAKYLPLNIEQGRAAKGAALALKARALIYAASDLYNTPSVWGSYEHPELVGYTNSSAADRESRWQKAKDAAKAVIDLNIYSLHGANPLNQQEAQDNYYQLFISMETSEDIFSRYFTQNVEGDWATYNPGVFHNPNGYHGWGCDTPTQQFVDAYDWSDGSVFDWSNPEHASDPYGIFGDMKRDPRFYATVLFDNAPWRERPSDVSGDPHGKIQTGHYWTIFDGETDIRDGLDTKGTKGGVENWNGTHTGYYLKKGVDANIDPVAIKQTAPWRFLRYAEVLLNYAEACIGLGQEGEAQTYINMVRTRAGMPDIATTGQELVKSLQKERQIEMAFEELRYFDIRRWMICEEAFADVQNIYILYGDESNPSPTYGDGIPTYTVEEGEERTFEPKAYFLPIALDELNINDLLVQNPGY